MLYDIPLDDKVKVLSYADDITLVAHAGNIEEAQRNMQQYLNNLSIWIRTWKFKLNAAKCSYQIFTNKKRIPETFINIDGDRIEITNKQRVLGVIFDSPRLSFKPHINHLKIEGNKRMCILKAISSNRWGASRNLLRRVYSYKLYTK